MKHLIKISTFLSIIFAVQAFSEPVVIGNKSVAVTLSSGEVKNLFLGKRNALPNGDSVEVVELADGNALKNDFHQKFTNKTTAQLTSYWSRLVFTGKGKLPKQLSSSKEVIDMVASNPKFIGYIDSSEVTPDVSVLTK